MLSQGMSCSSQEIAYYTGNSNTRQTCQPCRFWLFILLFYWESLWWVVSTNTAWHFGWSVTWKLCFCLAQTEGILSTGYCSLTMNIRSAPLPSLTTEYLPLLSQVMRYTELKHVSLLRWLLVECSFSPLTSGLGSLVPLKSFKCIPLSCSKECGRDAVLLGRAWHLEMQHYCLIVKETFKLWDGHAHIPIKHHSYDLVITYWTGQLDSFN